MSDAFERALAHVLAREGGFVNDPRDPGGVTKFGISKRSYPDRNIAALTEREAKKIYRQDFWKPLRCDEMPPALAACMFDTAVNQGVKCAVFLLQHSLRGLGLTRIIADGVIGPRTLEAIGVVDQDRLIEEFTVRRVHRYATTKGFSRFGIGWLRRAVGVMQENLSAANDNEEPVT